jgi:PKD repeat protein
MKKKMIIKSFYKFSILVILITLLNMLMPCSSVLAGSDDEVNIPDSGLSDAIASEVGPPPFTESELSSINYLSVSFLGISDLTGLEYCTNLVYLDLGNNGISDISALPGLTNLVYLYLGSNNISDISVLSGLTNLEVLILGINGISDISALSGLTNLWNLDLGSNDISDISALSGLTNLRNLYLGSNDISDIEPLVNNTGLGFGDFVDLLNNPLDNVSILNYIPELQDRGVTLYYSNPIPNQPPDADANGPYDVDEGETFKLDGSGSFDPDNNIDLYDWDLDNDGQYDDATGVTTDVTFNDNGSFTVGLRVTDKFGESDTATAEVTVNNVDPAANAGDPKTSDEGEIVAFSGSFTDPGTDDTHTITWDFGDSSPTVSGTLTPSHVYADDGEYTATLTVIDDDLGTGIATVSVTIENIPPEVSAVPGKTIDLGEIINGVIAEFTDAGIADFHIATIDWGDGTADDPGTVDESAGSGTVTGSHVYSWPGSYVVTVDVIDDDGSTSSGTFTVDVLPVPEVMVETLSDVVEDINLPGGTDKSLNASLDTAMQVLEDSNENNDVAAIKALQAFINKIEAQRGKNISEADADALIAKVLETIAALSEGE